MEAAHDTEATVRREVDGLLGRSPAFRELTPVQRRRLARDMAKVSAFLADPAWTSAGQGATAEGLADAVDTLKGRLAQKPGQVGAEFKAGAMRQGVEEFGNLVQKVDFPNFVSGLVQGVFNAVVTASIQQMNAYAEMLAAVAKSVDQFAQDHISDDAARDFVAQRHGSTFERDDAGRLKLRGDQDGAEAARALKVKPGTDLSSEEGERALVASAKLEMARSRQQLLATMVLMGINRIVVTNGKINAKVIFDIQASDDAQRRARASMKDDTASRTRADASFSGWGVSAGFSHESSHTTSVSSAVDDTSESKAKMKAQLSGDVSLQFKSETFPLERMVDVMGMQNIQQRAAPSSSADGGGAKRP